MRSNFRTIIKYLKERRDMLIPNKDSYECLTSFLIGYGMGKEESGETDVLNDFHGWLENKEGRNFSLHWGSYILHILCNGDEKKAINKALDLLTEFVNESSPDGASMSD